MAVRGWRTGYCAGASALSVVESPQLLTRSRYSDLFLNASQHSQDSRPAVREDLGVTRGRK